MKKTSTILILLAIFPGYLLAQDNARINAAVSEGKRIYRSEMASWYGSDIFLDKFKNKRNDIGGYFSYAENELTHCIFFSKGEEPTVLAKISFDSTFSTEKANISQEGLSFNAFEKDIYSIRKSALAIINSDTLFKVYKNTNLNLVPLIAGDEKKVYVLTGPTVNGVVVFGNDYLLTFDNNNKLIEKRQLHKNIIPIEYGKEEEGKTVVATMHSHLPATGEYITSTDIATLMLYGKMTKWQEHIVMSKKYVSIWNCDKNELVVLTKKAFDKISKRRK